MEAAPQDSLCPVKNDCASSMGDTENFQSCLSCMGGWMAHHALY